MFTSSLGLRSGAFFFFSDMMKCKHSTTRSHIWFPLANPKLVVEETSLLLGKTFALILQLQ